MEVFAGLFLTIIAVVVAAVDWFADKPEPGAPIWPRWIKLSCAVMIAAVGLITIFGGFFARLQGIAAYRDGDYAQAVTKLETATASHFANREAIDYLALAWKKQAEVATLPLVKEMNFLTSIDYMVRSINLYPCSPRAHNNLVNIFRLTARWSEGKDAANQLINKMQGGFFTNCDETVSEFGLATYYVTLGNFFVDEKNPEFSISTALKHYNRAEEKDPNNRFLILNLPPRLMYLAEQADDQKVRRQLIQRAYHLSIPALQLDEHEDRVFAMVNIIDALSEDVAPPLENVDHALDKLVRDVEGRLHSVNLDDETWLVLAKANIHMCHSEAAARNLSLARSENKHYNERQKAALQKLEGQLAALQCDLERQKS